MIQPLSIIYVHTVGAVFLIMQVSNNFQLHEFVPQSIYLQFGDNSLWYIDKRIITLAQFLRHEIKAPVIINNWKTGGQYNESGYRTPDTKTGAKYSQHKFGRAIDVKVTGYTPKDVHEFILSREKDFMEKGLTRMENYLATPTWTHLDCAYTNLDKILIVNP